MKKDSKVQVIFICTGNSARSQMAEGLLREKAGDIADVYSAGTEPAQDVHPLAKKVMVENGIDPSGHYPKKLDQFLGRKFDMVVTTCDRARENCPFLPGDARRYHWGLDDPATVKGNAEERLAAFRKTFAELSERISTLVDAVRKIHDDRSRE